MSQVLHIKLNLGIFVLHFEKEIFESSTKLESGELDLLVCEFSVHMLALFCILSQTRRSSLDPAQADESDGLIFSQYQVSTPPPQRRCRFS